MNQNAKAAKDQSSSQMKNQEKKLFLQTEFSQQPQGEDKQFSPWVKANVSKNLVKDNKQQILDIRRHFFLSEMKRTLDVRTPLSRDLVRRKSLIDHDKQFRSKAEDKFKQIIRKSIQQKSQIQKQKRFTQRAKHVNLNLVFQSSSRFLSGTRSQMDNHFPEQNHHKQSYLVRKLQKKKHRSSEKNCSYDQDRPRYNIIKTQQIFCKTLELTVPQKNINRLPQFEKKSHSKSPSFPTKPKIQKGESRNGIIDFQIEYNIQGSGINLKTPKTAHVYRKFKNQYNKQSRNQKQVQVFFQ